jgi:HK97 family phage major capsid protein
MSMRQLARNIQQADEINFAAIDFNVYAYNVLRHRGNLLGAVKQLEAQKVVPERVVTVLKAAVNSGTTSDSGWASALVPYRILSNGFLSSLRNIGCFDTLYAGGMRIMPPRTSVAAATSVATGTIVGQTHSKIVSRFTLEGSTLEEQKGACVIILSEELVKQSDIAIPFLGSELKSGIIAATDIQFLSTLASAGTPMTSAGADAVDVLTDIRALLDSITLGSTSKLFFVVDSASAKALSTKADTNGALLFPDFTPFGGTICGIQTLVSDSLPLQSGGSVALMIDASGITASSSVVTLDSSNQTAVDMDTGSDSHDANSVLMSLWQQNKVALRAERYFGFKVVRDACIGKLTNIQW